MIQKLFFISASLLLPLLAGAQSATLRGTVTEAENNAPVRDASVVVSQTGKFAATDNQGQFVLFDVPAGAHTLIVSRAGFLPLEQNAVLQAGQELTLQLTLRRDPSATGATDIPTITLDEAASDEEGMGEIANLLHASRDVFQNASSFGWSVFRFRERGYDSENFPLFLNGININDPETGMTFFGEFGGLNDVLRNRESVIGLDPAEYAFSEIGGATQIDTRASVQRKQIRASYAISNRTYTNRVMLTASTGLMPGGWAISVSGSRRWAQEGWYDATFFDGYAYFLSVDKKFGDKHALNLTFLGSPNSRGRVGDTFQEMLDLAGTTRYNPNWGYWNGKKRNAYVSHSHQPIAILRYDLQPSRTTNMMLAAYTQFGQNGYTRLDWFNAYSPEPDYNRRLPSALITVPGQTEQADAWAQDLRDNESLRQIDWVALWEANTNSTESIANANGVSGNTVTGKRAQYVIADLRSDSKEAGFNALLRQSLGERFVLNGGGSYQWYRGRNFKTVDDILGGDFIVDWDRFAQQDIPDNPAARDNNLLTPNHIVKEGETYGYDYDENIRNAGTWLQVQGQLRRFSLFAAAENLLTELWRTGYMQNGRFPNSSLGESRKVRFFSYGLKAGLTYKITGRQFLYANGYYGTRAQRFQDVFVSPRTRDSLVIADPRPYKIASMEGGLQWRAPNFKARITGYFTETRGQYDNYQTYTPSTGVFGAISLAGVNRRHTGVEMAFEVKPFVAWTFSAAANLGRYIYTSRPLLIVTEDNTANKVYQGTAYLKNFYVPRTPQTTASGSVRYEGRRFWFASLTLNWADNFWFLFDPTRRTAQNVETVPPDSDLWHLIIDQKRAPAAFTLDFFGGKSWRIRRNYFIYVNIGVNNILNNLNIINSGREAYLNAFRNDPTDTRLYSNQVLYAPGTNYFISLAFRM